MEALLKFNPDQAEIDAVVHPLVAYNSTLVGRTQFQPFAIGLRDAATGASAGDLIGMVDHDWLIVQFVFVPEQSRRQGHGRKLVERAEGLARERGLTGIWLDTFDFQSPSFFEALGFSVFGTLEDRPSGSRRRFMSKRLADAPVHS